MHISSNGVFCGSWWKAFVKPKKTNSFPVLGSQGNPFLFSVTVKMLPFSAPDSRKSAAGRGDTRVFQSITFPWSSFGLLTFPSRQTQGNALNNRVSKWRERFVLPPRPTWKDKSRHQNLPNVSCPFLTFRQEKEYLYTWLNVTMVYTAKKGR